MVNTIGTKILILSISSVCDGTLPDKRKLELLLEVPYAFTCLVKRRLMSRESAPTEENRTKITRENLQNLGSGTIPKRALQR